MFIANRAACVIEMSCEAMCFLIPKWELSSLIFLVPTDEKVARSQRKALIKLYSSAF